MPLISEGATLFNNENLYTEDSGEIHINKKYAFFTSSSKKNKELEELAAKYNKKCEINAHIVRSIIFHEGRM